MLVYMYVEIITKRFLSFSKGDKKLKSSNQVLHSSL